MRKSYDGSLLSLAKRFAYVASRLPIIDTFDLSVFFARIKCAESTPYVFWMLSDWWITMLETAIQESFHMQITTRA
tara:strand:- start:3959 stop:4186 length:228 start_codon:yes stop_codon:yes gene_type:complete